MTEERRPWLQRYSNLLKRARNVFDTLDPDEAVAHARFELREALRLLEVADEGLAAANNVAQHVEEIDALVDWSQYGWQRWFAWRPVFIVDRWYWLTHVVRRQWGNRPARYDYGRYRDATPPKQGA